MIVVDDDDDNINKKLLSRWYSFYVCVYFFKKMYVTDSRQVIFIM